MIRVEGRALPIGPRLARLLRRARIARMRFGSSPIALALRLAAIWRRTGVRPGEALELGLVDPALPDGALSGCFGKPALMALQDRLNPRELVGLTEDKSEFYPRCDSLDVPVPRTFAVVEPGGGWVAGHTSPSDRAGWATHLAAELPATFVTKPALGVYGEAVTIWTRREQGGFADHRGRERSARELYDSLVSHPKYARFVVQQRLESHPEVVRLSGSPYLQTVRMVTLVDAAGRAHLLCALWKVIVGDNVIDNYRNGTTGNLSANVAKETGLLGSAWRPSPEGVGWAAVPRHPATGVDFEGFQLPCWQEAVDLVLRCARLFLPLRTIGWDVALTPQGPVIVEGNRWWDPLNDTVLAPAAPGVPRHEMIDAAALLRREAQAAPRPGRG
jgi:hypothetical protein